MSGSFEVPVLLFAALKEAAGASQITVHVSPPGERDATVNDVLQACAEQFTALAAWLPHVRVAVNFVYVTGDQVIHAGDEIAMLPPVSGGAL